MPVKLTFLGASRNVTGSQYLLEANNVRVLVDCGLYQERPLLERNWEPFRCIPERLDAVLLTHAHLDHCGLIPRLVRQGFRGPIYGTAATTEITKIQLMDTAAIQQEDAAFKKRRHEREGRKGLHPEVPLYTTDDAQASFPLLSTVNYWDKVELGDDVEATFHDAGHVLGSSMIRLKVRLERRDIIIIFSGDIGRWGKPILHDPTMFDEADYVVIESTYGDRLLEPVEEAVEQMAEHINLTAQKGGNIVIPSFALERTQELMYYLNRLLIEDRIPPLMIFVDSPMANSITEVFEHHPELFNVETLGYVLQGKSPFDFPGLKLVRTTEESKAINHIKGTVIIIAGSGMCTGGRIKHHLVANISRPDSMILFVGYQAAGTLGRQIVDGAKEVRILGQYHPVNARVVKTTTFSGHADKDGLLRWLSGFRRPPKHLFITHGESSVTERFASLAVETTGWAASAPNYGDEVLLD